MNGRVNQFIRKIVQNMNWMKKSSWKNEWLFKTKNFHTVFLGELQSKLIKNDAKVKLQVFQVIDTRKNQSSLE